MPNSTSAFSVFEYLYRDAGNFKAWGELLLEGVLSDEERARLTKHLESGGLFIAEQIGVPTLYETLWQECHSAPSAELDHAWHEFSAIRPATSDDISLLQPWGSAAALLASVERVGIWNVMCSRNGSI
jgi:hypothetical protein